MPSRFAPRVPQYRPQPSNSDDGTQSTASWCDDARAGGTGIGRSGRHAGTGRPQVLARAYDPLGHALLGGLAPGARVVRLLVADVAIHLQDAVVVAEHVTRDRPGERILRIGVDVHLHNAVVERLPDLREQRPRAAMKHEVERLVLAIL